MFKKFEKAIARALFMFFFTFRREVMAHNCCVSPDIYVSVFSLIEELFPLDRAFDIECKLRRAMKEVRYV